MMTREGIIEGAVVRAADGEKIGKIVRVEGGTFTIEKGMLFHKEYLARMEDVADVRDGEVILFKRKDEFGSELLRDDSMSAGTATTSGAWENSERTEQRIPVVEEELEVGKHIEEVGRVRVTKDVVTERADTSVPVLKERVRVERVPASDQRAATSDASFGRDTVEVPIHEEVVETRKRPVVREEVVVSKDTRVEQRAASADLRKEIVDVDEEGRTRRSDTDPDSQGKLKF